MLMYGGVNLITVLRSFALMHVCFGVVAFSVLPKPLAYRF